MPPTDRLAMPPSPHLPSGHSLNGGQFVIQSTISAGSFGITYLASDNLKQHVAIKECYPPGMAYRGGDSAEVTALSDKTAADFEQARTRFLHEARMLARLDHPSIVKVRGFFEENGTAYMAMDFVDGSDFSHIIGPTKEVAPQRLLRMARALLEALDHAHNAGITHLDIKPDNIRINVNDVPVLVDFGAARTETSLLTRTAYNLDVVTDGYSPPEQYRVGAKTSPASDLYALAATLYHAIKGAPPPFANQRIEAINDDPPKPDPFGPLKEDAFEASPILAALINRSLNLSPEARPRDAATWLRLMDEEVARHNRPDATHTPKSRMMAGVALGATLALLAGILVWQQQPEWLIRTPADAPETGAMATTIADLRTQIDDADGEIARLQTLVGGMPDLEADMGRMQAERDQARVDLETALAEREDLNTQLNRALAVATARGRDLAQTLEDLEAAEAALAEAQSAIGEMETQRAADAATIADLERDRDRILAQLRDFATADPETAQVFPFFDPTIGEDGAQAEQDRAAQPLIPPSAVPRLGTSDPVVLQALLDRPFDSEVEMLAFGSTEAWEDILGPSSNRPTELFASRINAFGDSDIFSANFIRLYTAEGESYVDLEQSENVEWLRFSDGPFIVGGVESNNGRNTEILVWSLPSGRIVFSTQAGVRADAVVTRDGEYVFVADVDNGISTLIRYFNGDGPADILFQSENRTVWSVALADDERRIIASGNSETITGSARGVPYTPRDGRIGQAATDGYAVVSPDGRFFATYDTPDGRYVRIFDAATETTRFDILHPDGPDGTFGRSYDFSQDGDFIAIVDAAAIYLFDIAGDTPVLMLREDWTDTPEFGVFPELDMLEGGLQFLITPPNGPPLLIQGRGLPGEAFAFPDGITSAIANDIGDTIATGGSTSRTARIWFRTP